MKKDLMYLKDIIQAIESIKNFTRNMSFEEFKTDDKTSSATIQKFTVIGEATKKVSKEIRNKYSDIPWKKMAGMRDKLTHAYSQIDYELVWTTIKESIPKVKKSIEMIMKKEKIRYS